MYYHKDNDFYIHKLMTLMSNKSMTIDPPLRAP
jgi:hypothetical protein